MISVNRIGHQQHRVPDTSPLQPDMGRMIPAEVVDIDPMGIYHLGNGLTAKRACSCALVPNPGDTVLLYAAGDSAQAAYILHVLERNPSDTACISIPDAERLDIQQQRLRLSAARQIELSCAGDISLTAAAGTLHVRARQWVSSVIGSFIETARERVSRAAFMQFNSSALTQWHSKQAIIMADEDIKIDAERVNLG